MNLVEHIGSGIKRIREALSDYRLKPPLIEADKDWFSMPFLRKLQHETIEKGRPKGTDITPSAQPADEGVSEGVNEEVARLLSLNQERPGMRTPQISLALDVPIKTLERWLKKLREEGKIEFRGSPKTEGMYWIPHDFLFLKCAEA
jgi:ATP-dependent DNA helicase RecG